MRTHKGERGEDYWKEETDKDAERNALVGTEEDMGNTEEDNKEGTENDDENNADDNAQLK